MLHIGALCQNSLLVETGVASVVVVHRIEMR